MRWFSIGRLEVGFGGGRLIVATTGADLSDPGRLELLTGSG